MKNVLWLSLSAALLLTACPPTGVVCKPGTEACGAGCIDPQSDRRNCGGCGLTCATGQDCNAGACRCAPGTELCEGSCVVTDYDSKHCGACGVACGSGQVCEQGQCRASCTAGQFARCGTSCIDITSDAANCGGCGLACAQGQRCRASQCSYEAVAACYWSGQVVGFSPTTGVKGPLSDVGTNPAALASWGSTLLVADGTDRRLYTAQPGAGGAWVQTTRAFTSGSVPNQVLVAQPWAYVINAGTGSLQVLEAGSDAGVVNVTAPVSSTLSLGTVAELNFGMNSFPQGLARTGDTLWVPLYGGYGADAADAGQEVAKVDISNPRGPSAVGRVSLKGLDLRAFDGGTPVARPFAVTAHQGRVYVALNNLNPDTYAPEGPGLLARIDPSNDSVSVVDLGASVCLNPQWVAPVGDKLAVSCGGKVNYSPMYAVESVEAAGVVLVDSSDVVTASWSAGCPADAGVLDDGGLACPPMMPGRLGVSGSKVLVSDQNGGRVVVLEATDAGLVETQGLAAPLAVCPVSDVTGVGNVTDVLVP